MQPASTAVPDQSGSRGASPRPGREQLVLASAAVLLLAPSLALGTLPTHSSPQNLTWAAQFAEQVRAGTLYPRWMPDSFDGLGSPAFYFYPPLPYWIDALVSVITFNALPVRYRLALTSLVLLIASGLAMHAWLRQSRARPTAALVGATAYMAAPYHLLDHYMRGAFAEFTAYALLPLVVLGIWLASKHRRSGTVLIVLSYAALLMSHLPTALLASVTVIPAFVLFRARQPAVLLRCAAATLLGTGIAAAYLAPALALQDWISAEQLWKPFYHVENWFLLTPERWPEPNIMRAIAPLAVACATAALGLCVALLSMAEDDERRAELRFWIGVSLGCLVLMTGLLPWFWRLPEMFKVQFPWRLMVVIEFASVTAFCLVPFKNLRRGAACVFVVAAVVLVPGVLLIARDALTRGKVTLAGAALPQRDVKEYQPRGYPQSDGQSYADLGLEPLKDVPPITCTPIAEVCRASEGRFGTMHVDVETSQPTTVMLRRFFFPAWRVNETIPIMPTKPLRLVSFVAPAGRSDFHLQRVALPVERLSWAISGLSLVVLLAWVALASRGSKQSLRNSTYGNERTPAYPGEVGAEIPLP